MMYIPTFKHTLYSFITRKILSLLFWPFATEILTFVQGIVQKIPLLPEI